MTNIIIWYWYFFQDGANMNSTGVLSSVSAPDSAVFGGHFVLDLRHPTHLPGVLLQCVLGMHVCMYACMYACMYVCMYASMYAWMYECMHVCISSITHVCLLLNLHNHACIQTGVNGKVPCHKYWWTNIVYINNLYPNQLDASASGELGCMSWFVCMYVLYVSNYMYVCTYVRMHVWMKHIP